MEKWKDRKRPARLEKRFEFDSYEGTRLFLDRLADYSELINRFPDISFGKKYVNITLRPENDDKDAEISESDYKFAQDIDGFIE
tara:strand:- start:165 stop:416 length:252 start_codon:yes stop_codon:yes gene_type:complete